MHIFFSVGEPSGDQHAAHLIQELQRRRPDLQCSGYGGPLMEQAGCRLLYPLTNLAVMGILRVIPLLWQFVKLVRQAGRYLRESRPDAVVLVDFPGFNWWIARKAKAAGIPVFYYLPPQLWAWAPWRVKRMRKFVDHVLCGLPFEPDWYAQRGMKVEYVGHPFFDEVADYPLDRQFLEQWSSTEFRTVGLLPGSRNQEVSRNWPVMLGIVRKLHEQHPNARFLVACYKQSHLEFCREQLQAEPAPLPVHLFVDKTPEIIEQADCCLIVSGSVSLEMLARATPAVVIYRCGWLFYRIARLLVAVDSVTLPNLISGRKILPEYILATRVRRKLERVQRILHGWLSDPAQLRLATEQLAELRDRVVQTGASGRAADAILNRLPESPVAKAA